MSLAGRFWRFVRSKAQDFEKLDPDDVLSDELWAQLRAREAAARAAAAPPPGFKSSSAQSQSSSSSRPKAPPGPKDELARAYARLELRPGASLDEAKKAWRGLMKKYHPDRHEGDETKQEIATKVAAALTEAYELIKKSKLSKQA